MGEGDRVYYSRRAAEERNAADGATCERAAAAHREMAELYALLVQDATHPPEAASA